MKCVEEEAKIQIEKYWRKTKYLDVWPLLGVPQLSWGKGNDILCCRGDGIFFEGGEGWNNDFHGIKDLMLCVKKISFGSFTYASNYTWYCGNPKVWIIVNISWKHVGVQKGNKIRTLDKGTRWCYLPPTQFLRTNSYFFLYISYYCLYFS